jgi:Tfp pilus assembly protein FimV
MPESVQREILSYEMRVVGVFGRNRKVKSAHFPLAEVPATEPLTSEKVRELATQKLNEVKLKGRGKVSVSETPQTVEAREYTDNEGKPYTLTTRSFMLFSGRTLFAEEVG